MELTRIKQAIPIVLIQVASHISQKVVVHVGVHVRCIYEFARYGRSI